MSKEKQIEEMARIIGHCESMFHPDIECHNKATGCYCIENPCYNQRIADKLYNAGYRKQTEGYWIENEDDFWVMCSECGTEFLDDQIGIVTTYKYCPNCGAKMKGGDE